MNDETCLNERIEVVAVFGGGLNPCRPIKFKRKNGREISVSEIGLRHPNSQTGKTMHVFDITDGLADYRIELDSERLIWTLTRESEYGL